VKDDGSGVHAVRQLMAVFHFQPCRQNGPEVFMFGVEPAKIAYRLDRSPAVVNVLPKVVLATRYLIAGCEKSCDLI
jgi:hypothetical protein